MGKDKKLISILITHYNRPLDLLKCLDALKKINLTNFEIVVSDDGSDAENITLIKQYEIDKLILSKINQGLAANINKGIRACSGEYILYCQEDFILKPNLESILPECLELLTNNEVDLIRFTSNQNFRKLIELTDQISLIPKFSFKNILLNYYQYSDHPFITKKNFYDKYGNYLENTSGRYGEMEYAIRILKSSAKIAITKEKLADVVIGSKSILLNEENRKNSKIKVNKKLEQIIRAFRLYFEWALYRNGKRGLITYSNLRKSSN